MYSLWKKSLVDSFGPNKYCKSSCVTVDYWFFVVNVSLLLVSGRIKRDFRGWSHWISDFGLYILDIIHFIALLISSLQQKVYDNYSSFWLETFDMKFQFCFRILLAFIVFDYLLYPRRIQTLKISLLKIWRGILWTSLDFDKILFAENKKGVINHSLNVERKELCPSSSKQMICSWYITWVSGTESWWLEVACFHLLMVFVQYQWSSGIQ